MSLQSETELEVLHEYISELEEKVKVLEQDLIHDSLTGLTTRAFFNQEAQIYFNALKRDFEPKRKEKFGFKNLSFLFLDIDDFKKVNDSYGHDTGDEVLKAVARVVHGAIRDTDIASRWGGEEILIALPGADIEAGLRKAEEIRGKIEGIRFDAHPTLRVTISGGVAAFEEGVGFTEMIKRADQALYEAKESGKNKVVRHASV
ncbi:GGDEF domain-containing protein [Candidatus Parcubacteria bacterium]|nr:GGDEF domain-containing protein [Candidatus Parcubacteria bacterium]